MTTIYLDFDNTIVESNKRVIEIINERYGENKTEADLLDFGYNSIHPISNEEKLSIFASDDFFNKLEFKPRVIDIITKHYNNFHWVITTKGTDANLQKKFEWLDQHWPFKMERQGITIEDGLSKASVNMAGGIQIDDTAASLDTMADLKILYKDYNNFTWQQTNPCDDIVITNSWEEIDQILEFYSKFDVTTLEERN